LAKVTSPLFSFSASGALGKSLVFFPWKGLDCVRQWLIPANPNTEAQQGIRAMLKAAVVAIRAAQLNADNPLDDDDRQAYARLAATFATPRTWWNAICKIFIDQLKAELYPTCYRDGTTTPADEQLDVEIFSDEIADASITAGNFKYGTSPTLLLNTQAATVDGTPKTAHATLADLDNGIRYYWQFQPTLADTYLGAHSGIYSGVPAA